MNSSNCSQVLDLRWAIAGVGFSVFRAALNSGPDARRGCPSYLRSCDLCRDVDAGLSGRTAAGELPAEGAAARGRDPLTVHAEPFESVHV